MLNARQSESAAQAPRGQGKVCPQCGIKNFLWTQTCIQCQRVFSDAVEAAGLEAAHIEYLLTQLPIWRRRSLLANSAESRLRADYLFWQQKLTDYVFSQQASPASAVVAAGEHVPTSSPPDARASDGRNGFPNAAVSMSQLPMDMSGMTAAVSAAATKAATPPVGAQRETPVAPPPAPPRPAGDGLRRFFQKHALQVVFALATVLVLAALRSMLGWDWIGDVVMRLLPAVPLGLTAMFWIFGQKTRAENPWAAFVYHGLTAALSAFDVIALNKYWLPTPLTPKPVLLLAALAATFVAGGLLRRWREIPYLHLFQMGALTTLFGALQMLRAAPARDFHLAPLWLFGAVYLAYATFCLVIASLYADKPTSEAAQSNQGAQTTAAPTLSVSASESASEANRPESANRAAANPASALPLAVFGQSWRLAWIFWAHFSVVGVAFLAAVNLALESPNVNDFALLTLLTGLIYTSGAQLLRDARMVYAASVFLPAGGLLWLSAHQSYRLWEGADLLLLTLSAVALALAWFNSQTAAVHSASEALAKAYRVTARAGIALATFLAWSYALYTLTPRQILSIAAYPGTATALTLACGAFYLFFARSERRSGFLYAAFSTWGLALVNGLLILHAPRGLYPFAITAYGVVLFVIAARFGISHDANQKSNNSSQPEAQKTKEPKPSEQNSQDAEREFWRDSLRHSGTALATFGVLLAAGLPLDGSLPATWLWIAATLALGMLFYAHSARQTERERDVYAALACAAYLSALLTWRLTFPAPFHLADGLAPFALLTSAASLWMTRKGNREKAKAEGGRRKEEEEERQSTIHNPQSPMDSSFRLPPSAFLMMPMAWSALIAVAACLADGLRAFVGGQEVRHYALTLGPCLLSAALLTASRREENAEESGLENTAANAAIRRSALGVVGIAAGLEIGIGCGLTQGIGGWQAESARAWTYGLALLGWAWWLSAQALQNLYARKESNTTTPSPTATVSPLLAKNERPGKAKSTISPLLARNERPGEGPGVRSSLCEEMTIGGLSAAFVAALLLTCVATRLETWHATVLLEAAFAGVFALFALEAYRAQKTGLVSFALLIVLFAGIANAVCVSPALAYAAPLWTLLTLAASVVLLQLSQRLDGVETARASILPLLGGYGLYAFWEMTTLPWHENALLFSRLLWVIGGALLAGMYLHTARRTEQNEFAYMGGALLTACWLRVVTYLWPAAPAANALELLPFLIALYVGGMSLFRRHGIQESKEPQEPQEPGDRKARKEQAAREDQETFETLVGQPLRRCALVFSALALCWSALNGDGLLAMSRAAQPHLVTLTLAVYGLAYGLLALYRRSASAVAAGSVTLTAAYLHYLLCLTAWRVSPPLLSVPRFAFYAAQAGLLWLPVAWHLRKRLQRNDLAQPLLTLAGAVALASAVIALLAVKTPHEGHWTILTLAWAGAVWFALWGMEQGEVCLHVATWNLLAAWGIILYDRLGANVQLLDIYLLPVGLYLLTIGHLASRRQRTPIAQRLWWAGLLLILTPTYLAYWQRAGDAHTILFVIECLLAVLWGIGQRIRAFICVGLGFVALFAASISIGRLPDVWGTVVTLVIGVTLFIVGFYVLTHRALMQRWAQALENHWRAWLDWR